MRTAPEPLLSYDTSRDGDVTAVPGGLSELEAQLGFLDAHARLSQIPGALESWFHEIELLSAFCAGGHSPRPVLAITKVHPPALFDSNLSISPTLDKLSQFQASGPPPPPFAVLSGPTFCDPTFECKASAPVLVEDDVPSRARRCREQYRADVESYVDERRAYGILAERTTAPHRRSDLLRWPKMCRRAGVGVGEVFIAGARDICAEQVVAVKRCGIWKSSTLKPVFSGLRGYCRARGNRDLADRGEVWFLPRGTDDRRRWLTEAQLALLAGLAVGRVRIRVWLQGFTGMREDSARALLVRELMLDGPVPKMAFAAKGPDGERLTISVDPELAAGLRSWVESQGMGPDDRVYPVQHSQADADLRMLGEQAGLPFPLSGHVLRRSFARISYLGNPCIEQVRKIGKVLGHKDVAQTWWYIGGDYLDMDGAQASFRSQMKRVTCPIPE